MSYSRLPIISVEAVYENEAELNKEPNYEQRFEGAGANTHFIVVKREFAGRLLGIGRGEIMR